MLVVSDEILAKNISQMSKSLKQLEIDIKNVENQKADTADPDDKFAQVMSAFIDEVSVSAFIDEVSVSVFIDEVSVSAFIGEVVNTVVQCASDFLLVSVMFL